MVSHENATSSYESPIIEISSGSEIDGFEKAFTALYERKSTISDPELYREDSMALTIQSETVSGRITIEDECFRSKCDYDAYVHNGNNTANLEIEYANKVYLQSGRLATVIAHLSEFPNSKRALLLLWNEEQMDLTKGAACMTYGFFRLINSRLNMNVHMRANDAYNHLLIDLDLLRQIQQYVALKLGKGIGLYTHFVDSLHFYTKDAGYVDQKYPDIKARL